MVLEPLEAACDEYSSRIIAKHLLANAHHRNTNRRITRQACHPYAAESPVQPMRPWLA